MEAHCLVLGRGPQGLAFMWYQMLFTPTTSIIVRVCACLCLHMCARVCWDLLPTCICIHAYWVCCVHSLRACACVCAHACVLWVCAAVDVNWERALLYGSMFHVRWTRYVVGVSMCVLGRECKKLSHVNFVFVVDMAHACVLATLRCSWNHRRALQNLPHEHEPSITGYFPRVSPWH